MMDEIFEHQRKDREWRQTELGKAFYRYENLTGSAWVADSNEDTAEGRLKKGDCPGVDTNSLRHGRTIECNRRISKRFSARSFRRGSLA